LDANGQAVFCRQFPQLLDLAGRAGSNHIPTQLTIIEEAGSPEEQLMTGHQFPDSWYLLATQTAVELGQCTKNLLTNEQNTVRQHTNLENQIRQDT
jgi:hypothetical protein